MPPKSIDTRNVILLPSILPFLIAMAPPSGPVVVPVNAVPSDLKSKATLTLPFGVDRLPLHLPSTSAARAGTAYSRTSNNSANFFMVSSFYLPAAGGRMSPRRRLKIATETNDTAAMAVIYAPTLRDVPVALNRAAATNGAGAPPRIVPSVLLSDAPL